MEGWSGESSWVTKLAKRVPGLCGGPLLHGLDHRQRYADAMQLWTRGDQKVCLLGLICCRTTAQGAEPNS